MLLSKFNLNLPCDCCGLGNVGVFTWPVHDAGNGKGGGDIQQAGTGQGNCAIGGKWIGLVSEHGELLQLSCFIETFCSSEFPSIIMFRTASRRFAASAWRSIESASQLEAAHQTAINISKAQGVGQRGFLDGITPQIVDIFSRQTLILTRSSNWKNSSHPP